MATKINSANNAETFEFTWDEELYPTAFAAKVAELVNSGMTEQEARYQLHKYPNVTMEVVYSPDRGLFFVESDAIGGLQYLATTRRKRL